MLQTEKPEPPSPYVTTDSRLQKHLWKGARDDEIPTMNEAMHAGVSVNAAAEDGWTALHHAVDTRSICALQLLLEKKAEVNQAAVDQQTALHVVSSHKAGREPFVSPIAQTENEAIIQMLFDAKANVDLADKSGRTALMYAASCGYEDVLRQLLAAGADMSQGDSVGMTPLHKAAETGHLSIVDLLLDAKADFGIQDGASRTALHLAAMVTRPQPRGSASRHA